MITRTVCQRAGEGRKLGMIDAGVKKRGTGADHLGAQTACTRQPGGERASTGLRAVEGGKGVGYHRAISALTASVDAGATSRGYRSGRKSWRETPVAASIASTSFGVIGKPLFSHFHTVACVVPIRRANAD
jgi:hypothetical protein